MAAPTPASSGAESGEDRLIARFFRPLARDPGAFDLIDDAAILAPPPGHDVVLKTDAIVGGVVREQGKLDPQIDAALTRGWPLKRIEAVLRAVLRAGAYELACRADVPARVVMSEYVDVAGAFVDDEETGMVNAVLDQLAHQYRADEFAGATE